MPIFNYRRRIAARVRTHLCVAERLDYIQPVRLKPVLDELEEVLKMIYAMIAKIRSTQTAKDR